MKGLTQLNTGSPLCCYVWSMFTSQSVVQPMMRRLLVNPSTYFNKFYYTTAFMWSLLVENIIYLCTEVAACPGIEYLWSFSQSTVSMKGWTARLVILSSMPLMTVIHKMTTASFLVYQIVHHQARSLFLIHTISIHLTTPTSS